MYVGVSPGSASRTLVGMWDWALPQGAEGEAAERESGAGKADQMQRYLARFGSTMRRALLHGVTQDVFGVSGGGHISTALICTVPSFPRLSG